MITPSFDIHLYHWVWYMLGALFAPRLTIMIFVSIYLAKFIPLPLFVMLWAFTILANGLEYTYVSKK